MAVLKLRLAVPLALDSSFLVAWREILVQLSVDQVIAEDPAGTPILAVGPPLDSRGRLFVDEDISAAD